MKTRTSNKVVLPRRIGGQGMTEYIIIVALIAIAAIAAVSSFGGVVKDSFVGMSQSLAGETATQVQVDAAPAAGNTRGTLGRF